MEVLSVGKRLKKLRKELKIRQEEITGNQITRNLISIIENDKTNLTPKVAEVISSQINMICKERGLSFRISAEDLLKTEVEVLCEEVEKLIAKIIRGEYNLYEIEFQNYIFETDFQLRAFGLFESSFKLMSICESHVSDKSIELAHSFCKRANELVGKICDYQMKIKNSINLSYYAILLGNYEEAKFCCNQSMRNIANIQVEDRFILLMNLNISASELGDVVTAENAIYEMLSLDGLGKNETNKAKISLANRKYMNHLIDDAKKIYTSILEELEIDEKYLVYCNLLDIARTQHEENIRNLIEEILAFHEKNKETQSIYTCKMYYKLALVYRYLDSKSEYELAIEKALLAQTSSKLVKEIKEILFESIDYLSIEKSDLLEELIYIKITSLICENQLRAHEKVIWKYIDHALVNKELHKIEEITRLILSN